MVPSMNARLTLALRQSPRHSTSELSESEEIALVLTPTDTYRHLPHEQQKEKRKTDFEEMMATAAAQAEEPTADKSGLLAAGPAGREQRAQARREAEEKRRTNAEELAQKQAQAAAARTARRVRDVGLGENHTLFGEPIDVGRRDVLAPKRAGVGIAEVIDEQKNDVGRLLLLGVRFSKGRTNKSKKQKEPCIH